MNRMSATDCPEQVRGTEMSNHWSTRHESRIRQMMVQARAMSAPAADEMLPVEPGKGTVTVSVNGTVQMVK